MKRHRVTDKRDAVRCLFCATISGDHMVTLYDDQIGGTKSNIN